MSKYNQEMYLGIICLCILIIVLVLLAIIMQPEFTGEELCEIDCEELGNKFWEYKYPSLGGHEECWCRRGNETIRIR
jgi:hypothetical protein